MVMLVWLMMLMMTYVRYTTEIERESGGFTDDDVGEGAEGEREREGEEWY